MKKFLIILGAGILWCNISVADIDLGVTGVEDDWRRYKKLEENYNIN